MRQTREILATNVERLMARRGLNWKQLAEQAPVGKRTLGHLRGPDGSRSWSGSTLDGLAGFFRVPAWRLLVPLDESPIVEPREGFALFDRLDVQASAGPGAAPADHPAVVERVEVLETWARRVLGSADPDRIKIIDVRGDSMAPRLNDGDIVFVDVSVRAVDADGVYVFVRDGALHIKRLQRLGERLAIISDNNAYERDYIKAGEAAATLHVCGRVIGRWGFERAV